MKFRSAISALAMITAMSISCLSIPARANDTILTLPLNSARPAPQPVAGRDIIGMKLGMSAEQIADIMAAEGYSVQKDQISASATINGRKLSSAPYTRIVRGTLGQGFRSNIVAVQFTSPVNGNVATSISRYIEYSAGSGPATSGMLSGLSAKYGIQYGNRKTVEEGMRADGKMTTPLEFGLATPENLHILRGTLEDTSRVPLVSYFSAGVTESRPGEVGSLAVALLDAELYTKDRADLKQALADLSKAASPANAVAPPPVKF